MSKEVLYQMLGYVEEIRTREERRENVDNRVWELFVLCKCQGYDCEVREFSEKVAYVSISFPEVGSMHWNVSNTKVKEYSNLSHDEVHDRFRNIVLTKGEL